MTDDMLDTSWVRPFIHNLFSGDSNKADKYMSEKMKYINKPFYKYCYVCEEAKRTEDTIDYNILNFENDELFFQNPNLFNDPFDCYLGFSQIEMIKDLLVSSMKQQKKYTPQMRKAINDFFRNDTSDISYEALDGEPLRSIVETIITTVSSSIVNGESEQAFVSEMMGLLTNDKNLPLFLKLIQNKLTIADQQEIIDIMYDNKSFCEYTKSSLENPEHSEMILKMARHDMKLKVETHPDSFLSGNGTETFQLFDFFAMLIDATMGKEKLPELDEIKKQFSDLSSSAMEKSRKLISEQCKVTCLSEKMDSPLMWSHYANKHFGFCLEYDFTHSMINRYPDLNMAKIMLLPVIYSEKRPLLSKMVTDTKFKIEYMRTKKMPNAIIESIVYGLLFKSPDWAYEHEWRIIGVNMNKPTMKLPPARKLFLGANIEENTKCRLIEIANKKHIPVYQMYLSSDKYKFEYYKVN